MRAKVVNILPRLECRAKNILQENLPRPHRPAQAQNSRSHRVYPQLLPVEGGPAGLQHA